MLETKVNMISAILLLCQALVCLSSWQPQIEQEMEIAEVLKGLSERMEKAVNAVNKYEAAINKVYKAECGDISECPEETIVDNIIGNPIYNFQLLKRITVYYKVMEKNIDRINYQGALDEIERIKKKYNGLPQKYEREAVGRSFLKILDTYKLDINDVLQGILGEKQTSATLGDSDLLYLGKLANLNSMTDVSMSALEYLVHTNSTISEKEKDEAEGLIRIQNVRKKFQEKEKRAYEAERLENGYILGNVPPRSNDPKDVLSEDDDINYKALCRGETLLEEDVIAELFCYFTHKNNPYLMLQPLKVEEVHPPPHQMLWLHDVLTERETDELMEDSVPHMTASMIGQKKTVSDMRVGESAFIPDNVSPIVDRINEKINLITGLNGCRRLDAEGKKEEFEYLQIASYGTGGHFYLHHDPMYVYKSPDFIAQSVEDPPPNRYNTGDRMSTLMFYLNDVEAGGYTAFPRLGVAVRPERGSAVIWHNINPAGFSDMHMLHAACPVMLGRKMVANKWFREVANIFHRKCGLYMHDY